MNTAPSVSAPQRFRSFRARLVTAMMLVVAALTAGGLFLAERHAAREAEDEVRRDFAAALELIEAARGARTAALAQRCRSLVQKARIHAALEDDALDLLYPSARDELADLVEGPDNPAGRGLQATFWRFLDPAGAVIPVEATRDTGRLTAGEAARLGLRQLPAAAQLGFLPREGSGAGTPAVDQVIVTPIISTVTGRRIAALAVGFSTTEYRAAAGPQIRRGVWVDGTLDLPGIGGAVRDALVRELPRLAAAPENAGRPLAGEWGGEANLLVFQTLNAGSAYPPAFEVCLYPLAATREKQRELRWRIVGLGFGLMVAGLAASRLAATRLSAPVEKLAADSARNALDRVRAEAALELTQAELQRAARFSSDASHQLKTPVSVFRAGVEELLARDDLPDGVRRELMALVGQTYRFTGMIEDLLLLSRLDEGRLQLDPRPVDLAHLVASWLDDQTVSEQPDPPTIAIDLPPTLMVLGERRYLAMILQNLLENARKYNRPGGRIAVAACLEGAAVRLTVGNNGRPIPPAAQPYIFDRFHRGTAAETVPGHGLGLNLARELARLHGGELKLTTSADDWTEFEATFRLAPAGVPAAAGPA